MSTKSMELETEVKGDQSTNAQSPRTSVSDHDAKTTEAAVAADPKQDPRTVRPIHGIKWFITVFAMYLTAFLYGLDTTISADIQPNIVKSLGEIQKLAWIGSGFPLGSVAVILPIGYAYSMFEIKTIYLSAIILFEAGSALCGGAPTMNALIVGRVIAGMGGAGIYLGLLNYTAVLTTLREQSLYNSLIGLAWGAGCVCGPLVAGGFAVSSVGWRWSFYINLVLAAVFAPALIIYLPVHRPDPGRTVLQKLKSLDWVGIVLIAAVYSTFTLALTFGGAQWRWDSYKFAIMIAFFGITLIMLITQQGFSLFTEPARRVFPVQFLRSRTMVLLYITSASTITSMFLGAYYIPLYFQFTRGDSTIEAAVRLLPFIAVAITFVLLSGGLLPVIGYYYPFYVASGAFQIIGGAMMYSFLKADSSNSLIYGSSVMMAIGTGLCLQAAYAVAAAKTIKRDATQVPAAIGLMNIAQIGSIPIALTISGAIFQNLAYKYLEEALSVFNHNYSSEQIRSALAGTQAAIFQQWTSEERAAAIAAVIKAMDQVFILVIVAGIVTFLSGLAMSLKREKLLMTAVAGG